MLYKINDILMCDILWYPGFLSIFLFFSYFYLMKEPYQKILNLNNTTLNLKINFFKKKFISDYYNLIKFLYNFSIYMYLLMYFSNTYFFAYKTNLLFFNFQLYNYIFYYNNIITVIIIFSLFILKFILKQNITKSFEFLLSLTLFFTCLYYYIIVNNLIALIMIFEFQSLIFIYLLANNFSINSNFNNLHTLKNNNFTIQPLWYFNSLIYQFWVSFIGALLLIYSSLNFFRATSFNDWWNLEAYLYMKTNLFANFSYWQINYLFLPLLLGLLLKLGSLPFFLWKPEIYKNFNLSTLFIYMGVYSFSIIYFFIIFLNNYMYLLKYYQYQYIYIITIATFFIVSLIIYAISEIRPFLAYTSILHISFISITIFLDSLNNLSVSFLYLFTYLFFIFFIFLILFSLPNNLNIWYFTDIQYFSKITPIITGFSIILLSMAGIPPFLGFFAKISVASLLLFNEEYLLFILIIISGFFVSFFYIQNYRFFGYNIKSINYSKNLYIYKNNEKLFMFLYIFIFINLFSFFFINDFFIFTHFLTFNI